MTVLVVLATCLVMILAGHLVLGVMAEQRHRRQERELSAEVLVAAFRVHDVARQIQKALADEAVKAARS